MTPTWFECRDDIVILRLHVQPGARIGKQGAEIQGLHGDALKVRVAAAPIEGRANEELIRFLADKMQVPTRQIRLLSGDTSRQKRFAISGSAVDPSSLLAVRP
jgi:uncharacterized protein (TIGR00251 family)